MAFGIDDGLSAAAAAISLTSTVAEVIKKYRHDKNFDIALLIEQVRVEAIKRIDQADSALADFEDMLKGKGINPEMDLDEIIRKTPLLSPVEQYRLRKTRKALQALSSSVYDASDDIAALVRCKQLTAPLEAAVAETAPRKHEFHQAMLNAKSLHEKIAILRSELRRQKKLIE